MTCSREQLEDALIKALRQTGAHSDGCKRKQSRPGYDIYIDFKNIAEETTRCDCWVGETVQLLGDLANGRPKEGS
jgi:hypothetical protein